MSLTFDVVGDIGHYGKELFQLVRQSSKTNKSKKGFLAIVGDNFYPDGLNNSFDPQIEQLRNLSNNTTLPITAVLGNHDYHGNIHIQQMLPYWNMPDSYFFQRIGNIGIWYIDTVILEPASLGLEPFVARAHGDLEKARNSQLNWLNYTMSMNNDCVVKIVIGHYPMISSGHYSQNMPLISMLLPIFKRYNVTAYISGHDHNNQQIKLNFNGYTLNQFISGCTDSHMNYPQIDIKPGCLHFSSKPAFLRVKIDNKTRKVIKFHFVGLDGKAFHKYELFVS